MKKRALHVLATVVGCAGVIVVCTASFVFGNQPQVPADLLAKK